METKRCTKCGEEKPITEFGRRKQSKDGYQSHCKQCRAEAQREWRKHNIDKERAYQNKCRRKHPEVHRESNRRYAKTHKNEINARLKAKREAARLVPVESIERYPGEACYLAKARKLMRGEVVDPHCGKGDEGE